jgi:hypothetical protein
MNSISTVKKLYKNPDYDRVNNPAQLSINELMPIGVTWEYEGKNYEILLGASGSVCALNDGSGIAIMECGESYIGKSIHLTKGRAYIVNANDTLRVELLPQKYFKDDIYFNYIYYSDNKLELHVFHGNIEYRMVIDEATGNFLEVAECR